MKVEKKIYYHYHRADAPDVDQWKKDSVFTFDKSKYNYFYGYYDNFFPKIEFQGKEGFINSTINEIVENNLYDQCNSKYFIDKMKVILEDLGLFWRESLFEEVRLLEHPNLPSRKHCLWVCSDFSLSYWKGFGKLFKLELTGNIHIADDKKLKNEIMPAKTIRQNAREYWAGCEETNPSCEILFEGEARVLEEVEYK